MLPSASPWHVGWASGVQAVTRHLKQHFSSDSHDRSELSDKPVVL